MGLLKQFNLNAEIIVTCLRDDRMEQQTGSLKVGVLLRRKRGLGLQTQCRGPQRAHSRSNGGDCGGRATRAPDRHKGAFQHARKITNLKKSCRAVYPAQRVTRANHWVAWGQAGVELH